jgi:hypothetical protein
VSARHSLSPAHPHPSIVTAWVLTGPPQPVTRYGTCDVWCELALSLRSLATVTVYLSWREYRMEMFAVRTLRYRLWNRIAGCVWPALRHPRVRFHSVSKLEEVLMIPRGEWWYSMSHAVTRVAGALSVSTFGRVPRGSHNLCSVGMSYSTDCPWIPDFCRP